MFRIAQGRRLGIDGLALFANVGAPQNVQPFGIRLHEAIFDAVVNHLDEMAGAGSPAIKIAFLSRAGRLFAPRRARDIAASRRKRLEDRIQVVDRLGLTSNHQAETTLETPYATAGPDVEVMNTSRLEFLGAPDVVDVIGIASIHDDVVLLHLGAEAVQRI